MHKRQTGLKGAGAQVPAHFARIIPHLIKVGMGQPVRGHSSGHSFNSSTEGASHFLLSG